MSTYIKDYIEETVSIETHEEDERKEVKHFRILTTDAQVLGWLEAGYAIEWTHLDKVTFSELLPERDLEVLLERNKHLKFTIGPEFVEVGLKRNSYV